MIERRRTNGCHMFRFLLTVQSVFAFTANTSTNTIINTNTNTNANTLLTHSIYGCFMTSPSSKCFWRSSLYVTSSSSRLKSWGIGDNWSTLSSTENENKFDPMDPNSYSTVLSENEEEDNSDNDTFEQSSIRRDEKEDNKKKYKEQQILDETIDILYEHKGIVSATEDWSKIPALYDTAQSFDTYTKSETFIDDAGKEIALLVRCNQLPETLLIEEGRALVPLTDEERFHSSQLLSLMDQEQDQDSQINNKKEKEDQYQTTPFFDQSISQLYHTYAKPQKISPTLERAVMDAKGVSAWMSACLNESVGKHDKRVHAVMSRYSTYKTAYLESFQFHQLYLDAVLAGIGNENGNHRKTVTSKTKYGGVNSPFNRLKLEQPDLSSVWRDFKAHDIRSPVEREYQKKEEFIHSSKGTSTTNHPSQSSISSGSGRTQNTDLFIDECEILDWGSAGDEEGHHVQTSNSENSENRRDRSSHKSVELSSDGKTPKRLRDGTFVFIDEESCIGCTQCVQAAPSSFQMLENGRARSFTQSNNPEVDIAVSVCPVDCMKTVAFHELVEMETARDDGDGRSDHRHVQAGKHQLHLHTPLNVAGIGGDANHKSSWYHYLKHKCYTSKTCPQRGCYDCPMYSEKGANPHFKLQHLKAEHVRARDFIESGEADPYRCSCDL